MGRGGREAGVVGVELSTKFSRSEVMPRMANCRVDGIGLK